MQRLNCNEKGVSTLELAIALPLFITIIFGTVQISTRINSLQAVSAAANEGVKTASVYSNEINSCPTSDTFQVSKCKSDSIREAIPANPTLEEVANISTCNYLLDQGLDASNWEVTTRVFNETENGKNFPVIELNLKEIKKNCRFCIGQSSTFITNDSQASMSVNGCLVTDV